MSEYRCSQEVGVIGFRGVALGRWIISSATKINPLRYSVYRLGKVRN